MAAIVYLVQAGCSVVCWTPLPQSAPDAAGHGTARPNSTPTRPTTFPRSAKRSAGVESRCGSPQSGRERAAPGPPPLGRRSMPVLASTQPPTGPPLRTQSRAFPSTRRSRAAHYRPTDTTHQGHQIEMSPTSRDTHCGHGQQHRRTTPDARTHACRRLLATTDGPAATRTVPTASLAPHAVPRTAGSATSVSESPQRDGHHDTHDRQWRPGIVLHIFASRACGARKVGLAMLPARIR